MKTIATHSGLFHADEVFAIAVLSLHLSEEEITVVRTRDESIISSAHIAVDVGRKYDVGQFRFDHHQEGGAGVRGNGIPYASFGLIWKEYGLALLGGSMEAWEYIDQRLVCPIDAIDNGVSLSTNLYKDIYSFTIQDVVASYHGGFEASKEDHDKNFRIAVDFAQGVLKRELQKALEYQTLQKLVKESYDQSSQKKIIVLEGKYPWVDVLVTETEPVFVVYPDREGDRWVAKGVPVSSRSFERRKLFPLTWAGKIDGELQEVSGVPGALFCHTGRFIAVANSREGALALAEKALAH
jgi:uncharacterized UPF0160 family protein